MNCESSSAWGELRYESDLDYHNVRAAKVRIAVITEELWEYDVR